MLSRRPSNGLFTYNFELGRLGVTTFDSTTSLKLDECDYSSKLVLTLRQFRDAPRRGTKKVESGYLFILHSGTDAIERLDLRKVRQSTSYGAVPAYKIRAESGNIEFQYHSSDHNTRKIDIGFQKQDAYERALQILLSQGLSIIIKKPEQGISKDRAFVPTTSGSTQLGLAPRSFPVQPSTASNVPSAWPVSTLQSSHFTSREVRTPGIPMPPPVSSNARSRTGLGVSSGYYHSGKPYSPVPGPSGYWTPSQSQSQLSEETFPSFGWPPSQQRNQSFDSAPLGDFFHHRNAQARPPDPRLPTTGSAQYGTPQPFISSQSRCDPSFLGNGIFSQAASQHCNNGGQMNTPTLMAHDNSDLMLPPTRTLPFKSKSKKLVAGGQSVEPASPILQRTWHDENMDIGREMQGHGLRNPTTLGEECASFRGFPKESSHEGRAETTLPPETHYSAIGAASQSNAQHEPTINGATRGVGAPHLPTVDSYPQADTTMVQTSRAKDVDESPSASDTEFLSIFRTLEDAVERWRTSLHGGGLADLEEVLCNLQSTAHRLHMHLHSRNPESRKYCRNNQPNEDHRRGKPAAGDSQAAPQSEVAIMEANQRSGRRHTREYKQWKDYYLLACRLYETKEERTDPEFIHRFLRGIPGKRALRWVQIGLLHCYPSMVRLSERRSGTTIVFTKDLRWSQVCEMVTRKLKLPFPKWEIVHRP